MRLRGFISAALLVLCCLTAGAQTTKIRGIVIGADDGRGVPFAAVFFKGTTVGTTTDENGEFSITTRDLSLNMLTASMLSYRAETQEVKPGVFNNMLFVLQSERNQLDAVTVKADNSKAKRLLTNIDAHRDRNNPELRPGYSCDVYSKMELDLTHPREQLRSKALKKQWSFIFDYIDTSEVSGTPYLPVMINESVARRQHTSNPTADREQIIATQLSGVDPSGNNLVAQFTGSMHLKNNFYDQYINAFNVDIPSPISSSGLLFYNYFIIDSLNMDGRKTLLVRYHPKPAISTPAFDGEMMVDAEEFALRSIKARIIKHQNINWVRDMVLEASYQRMQDSTWFYRSDRFYADFSIVSADSSKLISFIGNRNLEFSNPDFSRPEVDTGQTLVTVEEDASQKDSTYWSSVRPYALSQKEQDIYAMVEQIQDTPLYHTLYDVVYTIINGYWDIGPVGIGPYLKIFSYNPLEGFRLRLGLHTSVAFSKKDRLTGYLAYGFKDRQFKGGGTWEHLFSKAPTRKLTVDGHYDVLQLGRGTNRFNDGNILASVMGAGKTQKLCPVTEGSILYEHEFNGSVNSSWTAMFRQYHGNSFVPTVTPEGLWVSRIPTYSAAAQLRFSWDETVTRGHFIKTYTHTDHPVLTLDLQGGMYSFNGICDINGLYGPQGQRSAPTPLKAFFRPELSMDWKVRIPPVGMSRIHLTAGTIVGQVPYPMLHLHEGNGTYLMDKTSFSTMDFFEFASDSWVTLLWDHNFYGFFLGKIPWVKRLQLREAILLKATWGYLSDKNDGTLETARSAGGTKALMLFPESMHRIGNVPFIEMGFGITNILRVFRVDFIWRVTHREDPRPKPRNFTVNAGVEFKF